MRFKKIKYFLLFCLVGILSSCLKPKVKEINPQFAVPLAYGNLSVADLLARADSSELIQINPQGLMALSYEGSIVRLKASDIFVFPNASASIQQNSPTTLLAAQFPEGQTSEFAGNASQTFALDPFTAKELKAKAGLLRLKVTSSFSNDVAIELTLPNTTRGGIPLQANLEVKANASSNTDIENIGLGDYIFDFGAGNEITFNYNVTITSRGQDVLPTDNLIFEFEFIDVKYKEFRFASFNNEIDLAKDSIDLRIFKNLGSFSSALGFGFFDPSVVISIENSFNVNSELEIETLETRNASTGDVEVIALASGFSNPLVIGNDGNPYTEVITTDSITKNNSNINQVLTPENQYLTYDFAFRTIDNGSDASISDESSLGLRAKVNLPLAGFAKGIPFSDTLEINADLGDIDLAYSAVKMHIRNQFPVNADLQVYFLNKRSNGTFEVTDSLIKGDTQTIIPSGAYNTTTNRSEIAEASFDFELNEKSFQNLKEAEAIYFRAVARTSDADQETLVSIYKDYFMEVSIGLNAKFNNVLNAGGQE